MTDFSETTIQRRIQEAVMRALGISVWNSSAPLRMGSTPGWDSMGHMSVVLELEKEFEIRFAPYELPQLIDVPSIEKFLRGAK
jgi:acyl carrier protein